MKTKVTILGQEPEEKKLKPIEFKYYLHGLKMVEISYEQKPPFWDNIVLLRKNYDHSELDLMYAYKEEQYYRCLFLGHFNDGIVE